MSGGDDDILPPPKDIKLKNPWVAAGALYCPSCFAQRDTIYVVGVTLWSCWCRLCGHCRSAMHNDLRIKKGTSAPVFTA